MMLVKLAQKFNGAIPTYLLAPLEIHSAILRASASGKAWAGIGI
jgi:hypothetical protein